MNETFRQINALSEERLNLYRLAAKQHLNAAQQERLHALPGQLEVLWDQYRREIASASRPQPLNNAA